MPLTEQRLGPGRAEVQFVQVVYGIHDVELSVFVNAGGASVLGRVIHCPWNMTAALHAGLAGGLRENHGQREAGRARTGPPTLAVSSRSPGQALLVQE